MPEVEVPNCNAFSPWRIKCEVLWPSSLMSVDVLDNVPMCGQGLIVFPCVFCELVVMRHLSSPAFGEDEVKNVSNPRILKILAFSIVSRVS